MEDTITHEAVKQRIRCLIGEHEPFLESLVGGNVNGFTIPPGGLQGSLAHDAILTLSEGSEERLEELGQLNIYNYCRVDKA